MLHALYCIMIIAVFVLLFLTSTLYFEIICIRIVIIIIVNVFYLFNILVFHSSIFGIRVY